MKLFDCPYVNFKGFGAHESARWACIVNRALQTYIPVKGKAMRFMAGDQVLASLSAEGLLEIKPWYACDGYSPAIPFMGGWIRVTPTPKHAGLFPAILHDLTRQFCETEGCPWTREDSDTWFYNTLVSGGENKHIAGTYYGAVSRTIGNIWYRFRKEDPTLKIVTL